MHYLIKMWGDEMVDLVPFCSDWCHQSFCKANNLKYEGWNGAHEGADAAEFCSYCLEEIHGNRYDV